MDNANTEIEQMLAKPEYLATPVFSRDHYLSQVTYAMMGRFLRATNQPKEKFDQVKQKHVDAYSACAMTGLSARSGIFVVWAFDLDKQGVNGQSGLGQFRERAKRPETNAAGTSSTQIGEWVLVRGVLRIQTDSPASPLEMSQQYQLCQLKNVGWYVAGLVPPGQASSTARQPAPAAASAPHAAPPLPPEKIQIREDARTFREFYPDAAQRHIVHYAFAHRYLPQYVRQNPAAFFNHNFPADAKPTVDRTRFIQSRWMTFEERAELIEPEKDIFGSGMVFRRVTDLTMDALKVDNRAIALVCMPAPEQHVEAYFVAVVLQPELRIFTLEAMASKTSGLGPLGVVCESMADRRQNFGICVPPDRDAFLKAIIEGVKPWVHPQL